MWWFRLADRESCVFVAFGWFFTLDGYWIIHDFVFTLPSITIFIIIWAFLVLRFDFPLFCSFMEAGTMGKFMWFSTIFSKRGEKMSFWCVLQKSAIHVGWNVFARHKFFVFWIFSRKLVLWRFKFDEYHLSQQRATSETIAKNQLSTACNNVKRNLTKTTFQQ